MKTKYVPFKVVNQYAKLGMKMKKKDNPFQFNKPTIALFCAKTGAGKSNLIPSFVNFQGGFDRIILFTGTSVDEPIYMKMKRECPQNFEGYNGFGNFNKVLNDIKNDEDLQDQEMLLIVDDFLGQQNKVHNMIAEFATHSRKTTQAGMTFIILSQSYYQIPKLLREQVSYYCMGKGFDLKEFKAICNRFACCNLEATDIYDMYEDAVENGLITDFFTIDKATFQNNLKFRKGFDLNYVIDDKKPSSYEDLLIEEEKIEKLNNKQV